MHSLALLLGNQALVLREFTINYDGPEYVRIVARKAGLISWILTLIGIDVTTVFKVFANRIEFEQGSLSGRLQTTLPLRSVSIATCGYMKPFVLLALAFIALAFGLVLWVSTGHLVFFVVLLALASIFLLFYFLKITLVISVVSHSGWPASICFKRSIIEGVSVGYEQANEVIRIINELMMTQASK